MKNNCLYLLKILVSGILLYLIISKMDWQQLTYSLKHANLFYITMGLLFGLGFNIIKFVKWHTLIKSGNNKHSYWDGAKSYMIGNALGLVTPMRAGDIGRALYFLPADRPRIIGLTIMDRLVDLIAVLVLSIGGSFILINSGFGVLVIILSTFSLFIVYGGDSICKKLLAIMPDTNATEKVGKCLRSLSDLDFKEITVALFLAFLAFILIIFEFYCLVTAFEDIALPSIYLVTPLITLSTILPISLMGLGVREGLSIYFLAIFGVSAPAALSAAFLFFLINNVSISIIGVLYLGKVEVTARKVSIYKSPACPKH